jgi:hypothetical protein
MARKLWLRAHFGLNAKDFDNGLSRVTRKLHQFDRGVRSIGSNLAGVFNKANVLLGTFGAGLSLAGLTAGIKKSADELDRFGKLSDILGVSTERMAALKFAAEQNGFQFDQLVDSIKTFRSSMGKAIAGVGEQRKAFGLLGLDAKRLAYLDLGQALGIFADRLNMVTNRATKMAIAQDVFEETGYRIIPMLSKGSAGLNAYAKEAERLGLAVSRVDVAKIEAANAAITAAKNSLKGVFNTLAVGIAPVIKWAADGFTEWGVSLNGATKGLEGIGDKIVRVVGFAKDLARVFEIAGKGVMLLFENLAYALNFAFEESMIKAQQWANKLIGLLNKIPGVNLQAFEVGGHENSDLLWRDLMRHGKEFKALLGEPWPSMQLETDWNIAKADIQAAAEEVARQGQLDMPAFELPVEAPEKLGDKLKDVTQEARKLEDSIGGINSGLGQMAGTGGRLMAPTGKAFSGMRRALTGTASAPKRLVNGVALGGAELPRVNVPGIAGGYAGASTAGVEALLKQILFQLRQGMPLRAT